MKLVSLPPGRNTVSCKWVFKYKYDDAGNIIRFKAQLVIGEFNQVYGADYLDIYAPAKLSTLRILLAIAEIEDLETHQMDVVTSFLLSALEDEIYMEQAEDLRAARRLCASFSKAFMV